MSATPTASGGRPTGAESIGSLQTLSRTYTNSGGQVTQADAYFDLTGLTYSTSTTLGTEGTHFYRTRYGYDSAGRLARVQRPTGTIERTVYDALGRVSSVWVGLDDGDADGNSDGVPDRPSSSLLRSKTMTSYDEQGRAYRTETYGVDPSTGTVSTYALTRDTR
jgi:YD repeat-containing protein